MSVSAYPKVSFWRLVRIVLVCTNCALALETEKIHGFYVDGEFGQAIPLLEEALRTETDLTNADSVFIMKYLGVMYTADPDTREKGKYYMYQLLSLEPSAKILDMYASDMVYMIFHTVQSEFNLKQLKDPAKAIPEKGVPKVEARKPEKADSEGSGPVWKRPWLWITGIGVTGAVAAYLVLAPGESEPERIFVKP